MASGRIKGITIQLDADATPLQKALGDIDKSLTNTQRKLKDIDKLLKLDPKNTELLKQKQQALKDAISQTKDRLQQLKDAQSQVSEGTAEWDALQREIIETEQKLDNLEQQYKDFGSVAKQQLQAVSEKVKEVGGKVTEFGEGMTKKVTAPIAAVGAASLAAFKSVDDGYDVMIAKTGATGEAAGELRTIMENLATSIPTDFNTAGEAVGEVATRFGVTGEALESLSGQFIKFAQLNNTDVSTSVDGVQKALAAFGLGAEDAEAYLDVLNKTGQETGISTDKLTQGLVTNGAAFQELGLDINQSTQFMGKLEKSGADSNTVLTGMKRALKNATKEGKPLNAALSDLQNTILNGTGSMDGLTAAYDLFGKSGDQIYAAVKNGTLDFNELAAAAVDAGGNINTTFEETVDPMDDFQTTLNELKILGAEVGGSLLEALKPVLEEVANVIQILKEKWDALSPETQNMIIQGALIAAAIGPIIVIVGQIITSIGAVIGVLGALLSPIGLVVAAIGGLVAAGVWLYKNWDTVKEKATAVKDWVVEKWTSLKENVSTAMSNLKETLSEKWGSIKEKASTIATLVKDNVTTAWSNLKENVSSAATTVKEKVSTAWENIKTKSSIVWEAVNSNTQLKWATIKNTVSDKVTAIKDAIYEKFLMAKEKVTSVFTSIKEAISEKIESAKEKVRNAIDTIKGFFNFSWSLPHLNLPHFSISGSFSLNPPSIPHIGVEWYKKAYDNPYLFTTPTIIGGKGFGDGPGAEFVYGYENLMRDIAQAKGGDEITINVYASEGMNIHELAQEVGQELALAQQQRAAVYA